jgi:hypothetical protein
MKTFKKSAAQGDILIRRISKLPDNVVKQKDEKGRHIVAHSETGHHHTVQANGVDFYHAANDPMIMFLVVDNEADLIHNRSFDTHEPLRFDKGIYEIRRQREYTPEGWRRVAD